MNKYYYDLHIHSCLSPCGDDESTPNSIAGFGTLCGLNIMALTDHNTCKNCPAFFKAAKRYGIIPIAGCEVTTSEDVHVVFLFENLESAMEFDTFLDSKRIKVKNKAEIFGNQFIVDDEDNIIGTEENLLINATTVSISECPEIAKKFGGISYPAHIDRDANGVIAVLGDFPRDEFNCFEIYDDSNADEYISKYGLQGKKQIVSSDAHYLQNIRDKQNYFCIDDEPYSSDLVRKNLIEALR